MLLMHTWGEGWEGIGIGIGFEHIECKYACYGVNGYNYFDVMGKGDFHSSLEAISEFNSKRHWTYKQGIEIY